jgi:hypothetical protein
MDFMEQSHTQRGEAVSGHREIWLNNGMQRQAMRDAADAERCAA